MEILGSMLIYAPEKCKNQTEAHIMEVLEALEMA
jgi:hypothetical protein